jgi:hypothetical protein
MSHPTSNDRRDQGRISLSFFLNEYVQDRLHRVVTSNMSAEGLYVHRAHRAGAARLPFGRQERFVQLELTLPGSSEVIWARGEVRYDELSVDESESPLVHGTGIWFREMARGHARMISDFVEDFSREQRRQKVAAIHGLWRSMRFA